MDFLISLMAWLQHWEWIGAFVARVSVGLLFALSGCGKLFVPAKGKKMEETLRKAGIPSPATSAKILSTIEFLFGIFLGVGFLTPLSCIMLIGVMAGALITTVLPGIKADGFVSWLNEFLYLPEVMYVVILFWLMFSGPGKLSVDHLVL